MGKKIDKPYVLIPKFPDAATLKKELMEMDSDFCISPHKDWVIDEIYAISHELTGRTVKKSFPLWEKVLTMADKDAKSSKCRALYYVYLFESGTKYLVYFKPSKKAK